jgi:hypothetical protein
MIISKQAIPRRAFAGHGRHRRSLLDALVPSMTAFAKTPARPCAVGVRLHEWPVSRWLPAGGAELAALYTSVAGASRGPGSR